MSLTMSINTTLGVYIKSFFFGNIDSIGFVSRSALKIVIRTILVANGE